MIRKNVNQHSDSGFTIFQTLFCVLFADWDVIMSTGGGGGGGGGGGDDQDW
jgi:hypothetical protein